MYTHSILYYSIGFRLIKIHQSYRSSSPYLPMNVKHPYSVFRLLRLALTETKIRYTEAEFTLAGSIALQTWPNQDSIER